MTTETRRQNCQHWIEEYQTVDSYTIGGSELNWLRDRQEWQLILANGEIITESAYNGVGDILELIPDSDIDAYYATIAEWYDPIMEAQE